MIKLTKQPNPNPTALRNGNYKHPTIKSAVRADSYDKCIYCESRFSHVYFGDVEHMKPKSKFPEFEFDWDNLGYVCAKCNNAKANTWDNQYPFINPYIEDPSNFLIAVGVFIYHLPGNKRGEITEKEIKLNRSELIETRKERIDSLRELADKYNSETSPPLKNTLLKQLNIELQNNRPYTMCVKSVLKALLN